MTEDGVAGIPGIGSPTFSNSIANKEGAHSAAAFTHVLAGMRVGGTLALTVVPTQIFLSSCLQGSHTFLVLLTLLTGMCLKIVLG